MLTDDIRSGTITEGQSVDFKSRLDLKEDRAKALLIQTVVAFLNANSAHVYVGVREGKNHVFERFEPYDGDADEKRRQLQSILLDGIDPSPIGIVVNPLLVDGGYILDIDIPDLRMRPYQARATAAFHIRTGAQNTPLPRDTIRAMFATLAQYQTAAAELMKREDESMGARSPGLPAHAVTLHVAVVPGEHFEQDRSSFTGRDGPMRPSGWRHWHEAFLTFSGCDGGFETVQHDMNQHPICRLFVGDDWRIHSLVAFPFAAEGHGRVTIHEFRQKLTDHLSDIDTFFETHNVRGPFAVMLKIDGLQRDPKVAWLFPNTNYRSLPSAKWTNRVADAALVDMFHRMVTDGSRYGGY